MTKPLVEIEPLGRYLNNWYIVPCRVNGTRHQAFIKIALTSDGRIQHEYDVLKVLEGKGCAPEVFFFGSIVSPTW